MKELWVGLLVIIMVLVLSGVAILLLPILLMLGMFLRLAAGLFVLFLAIWLVGKVTLFLIDSLRKRESKQV